LLSNETSQYEAIVLTRDYLEIISDVGMIKKTAEREFNSSNSTAKRIEERHLTREPILTREELDEPGKVNYLKKIEQHELKIKMQRNERKLQELKGQKMVLYGEALERIDGVRGFKVKLLKKIEEKIEKGNSLLSSSVNKEEITEFLNELDSFLASFNGKESYEDEIEIPINGGEMRPRQVIVGEKVVQAVLSQKEDEINSLRGKLEDLAKKLEESSTAESPDSSFDSELASTPIGETEKKAIIYYLDDVIRRAAFAGKWDEYSEVEKQKINLKEAQGKVFSGEPINYSQKISDENNQQGVEKIRARIVDAVFYYVNNLKGGSGRPAEAKKVLENFANVLKKEIETELGTNFVDLPVEQQNLLKVGGEINSARKLTENE